jgi:hypothetical protein
MKVQKLMCVVVCAAVAAIAASPAHAQCTASQNAAVQCFIDNAVTTNLTSLRYGMSLTQFEAYGISVSNILQDQPTLMALLGMAGAVADAMPPTNLDASANVAAQQTAMNSIVASEVTNNLFPMPAQSNQQDLQWFSLDLVSGMNSSTGVLLSPGTLLRVVDSYVVTATTGGVVNWTRVNTQLASMVNKLASAGLLKLPPSFSQKQAVAFTQSLAQIIYTYKAATGRANL